MPTEEYPWLAKYTAGVAATLTSAAIVALARYFIKFNRSAAISLVIGLTFILACLWSYLITGDFFALPRWVWRQLFTQLPLWAVLLALAAGLLAVPTFHFLYTPSQPQDLYSAVYPWGGLKWQVHQSLDGEATIALCPRNNCSNELDVIETHSGTTFRCTRCGFKIDFTHSSETMYNEARKERRRRLRLPTQI